MRSEWFWLESIPDWQLINELQARGISTSWAIAYRLISAIEQLEELASLHNVDP